jgi:deoxyadenosine/deoxycytidine kinase
MKRLKIGVVGPCASGKSTLVAGLSDHEYWGKHIAQEHSYVADMWQRMTRPDILIYLNVSYDASLKRRKTDLSSSEYEEQVRRLQHARQHADLTIETDEFAPKEVLAQVLDFLSQTHYPFD